MASSSQVELKNGAQLKHLDFVRILAINAVVLVSNLYDYAKENAGQLKSTVGKVEDTVVAVVGPTYERFKGVPSDVLVFLDNKVDEVTTKFDECAPPAAKKAVFTTISIVKRVSKISLDLVEDTIVIGPFAAISNFSTISKDFAVTQLAVLCYKANHNPALHGVSEMAVTTVSHWSEKYNQLVKDMAAKGYGFFEYVPLVPVEEMAKAYKQVEAAASKKTDEGSSSESESDKEE